MSADQESLVLRYREGDEQAFAALVDGCDGALRAHVGRRLSRAVLRKVSIADVLQETRLVAFQRRDRFDGRSREDFRRWLIGIAERRVRATVQRHAGTARRDVAREVSRDDRARTAHAIGREPSPSQVAVAAELAGVAARALRRLPPDYREVLRLVREEGLSLRQAGERMGRSHEAARKLHRRALVRFTEIFAQLQGDDDE